MENIERLQKIINYRFNDKSYLVTALTHSSFANETKKTQSNERLEFLGDAVLSIVVSEFLFTKYQNKSEGELTRIRASLVCEEMLSVFATKIELGSFIRFGKGEHNTGGNQRPSILADGFEALIAAIFMDGGMEEARKFVLGFVNGELCNPHQALNHDYKTSLQEIIQQNSEERLQYVLVEESGPDHDKRFKVEVHLNSNVIGTGGGKSKKEAEQQAAREALKWMGY
ncbi:MAG: ribonuclease III [Oscillospiraceae bacterium]|jgi:ribonuclease-3|nr:ribonuclease III [Oscillospiraceae bacterium]